jgi:lipopolysaccharide export system protein LptA
MSDDQSEGSADTVDIQYARDKRLMVLTGNVKLTLKPRKAGAAGSSGKSPEEAAGSAEAKATQAPPASGTSQQGGAASERSDDEARLRDYPIEVACDRVEYEYARDKRHAILTGGFRAVQKLKDYTRTLTADRAEWFGREERVVLKGPVKLEDTKGRKGETPEDVTVFMREGKEGVKLRKGTYTMPVEEEGATPPAEPPVRQTPPPGTDAGPPRDRPDRGRGPAA